MSDRSEVQPQSPSPGGMRPTSPWVSPSQVAANRIVSLDMPLEPFAWPNTAGASPVTAVVVALPAADGARLEPRAEEKTPPPAPRRRVLVVDDNHDAANALKRLSTPVRTGVKEAIERHLLHLLTADNRLMAGNAGWSYTLNRDYALPARTCLTKLQRSDSALRRSSRGGSALH